MARLELLLPQPRRVTSQAGRLLVPLAPRLRATGVSRELPACARLQQALERRGLSPFWVGEGEQAEIELVLGGAERPQGYRLQADGGKVRIEARDAAGLFYG